MELGGAVVVVTGGAGGIGEALASAFRGAGATVATADLPGRVADLDVDVTDRRATTAMVEQVRSQHGRLDVVVANAGIGIGGSVADIDAVGWDRTIDVNIRGTVNTLLPALPVLREQRRGAIVLMSSLSGLAPTPLLTPYTMSKFALVGLAGALRAELAPVGVGVTVVCPGPVETPLLDERASTPGMQVRRYLTAAAGPAIAPGKLAGLVVEAVRKDRPLVVPGRAKLIWRLGRWAPNTLAKQLEKGMHAEIEAAKK